MPLTTGFSISKEDMLRGKAVKPQVYLLVLKSISQKPAKTDPDSITTRLDFMIEEPTEYANIPVTHNLSDKAPGLAKDFFEAILNKKLPEDGVMITKEQLASLVGRKVKAPIKMENDPKYGMQKRIEGWMPA